MPPSTLPFSAQGLPCLCSQCIISPVQEPQKSARHDRTANNIPQRDRDSRLVDELADAEVCAVKHSDGDKEEIGDGVLITQCDAAISC